MGELSPDGDGEEISPDGDQEGTQVTLWKSLMMKQRMRVVPQRTAVMLVTWIKVTSECAYIVVHATKCVQACVNKIT